jgi:hypothetical protein
MLSPGASPSGSRVSIDSGARFVTAAFANPKRWRVFLRWRPPHLLRSAVALMMESGALEKKQMTKAASLNKLDVLEIERISNALVLIADGVDEITDMGSEDLDGKAALGFANIVRVCGENLHALVPSSDAKKGEANE